MGLKKMWLLLGVLGLGCALGVADRALAQGEQSSGANTAGGSAVGMREKLKAPYQENVQQRHEDMQKLRGYRKDLKEEIRDKREDIRDRREDFRDRREDIKDRREDIRDRREDFREHFKEHRGQNLPPVHRKEALGELRKDHDRGVKDHGAGIGAGKGQGGMRRSAGPAHAGGGGHKR